KTVGIGHFEPLRHYAEVQLLMEPQPRGTGLVFDTRVSEDVLDLNWQRLVLSHLYEKVHRGILTGAPLTDTKITLVIGRAHLKHTEGGDFREATYRAVRQGLMKAGCVLLEPYYRFRLDVPKALVGRAMSDLQMKFAEFEPETCDEERTVLKGRAPVSELCDYAQDVISYTRGAGTLSCVFDGYAPCHNTEQIVAAAAYDPLADLENTPHSVFCSHGAGEIVPWNEVDERKHLTFELGEKTTSDAILPRASTLARKYRMSDEDFEAMMLKDFGPVRLRRFYEPKVVTSASETKKKAPKKPPKPQKAMFLIDGYNLIYSWDSLKSVAGYSLEHAREVLMDVLSDYVAYTKTELVLVFDAYRVKDGRGSDFTRDGYRVVYTSENETADAFIERFMYEIGPNYHVRLVTSDRLLQFSAVHSGISRMTAKEFENEITRVSNEITAFVRKLSEN
ncbi:MAG: NYN domain-containing protein, partial [Clostridia bacterium]|nr:NYN domain-containing protein [Clostridia bacterium]